MTTFSIIFSLTCCTGCFLGVVFGLIQDIKKYEKLQKRLDKYGIK